MENYFESQRDQIFRCVSACPTFFPPTPHTRSKVFKKEVFKKTRNHITCSNVEVLIYVFDIESQERKKDLEVF